VGRAEAQAVAAQEGLTRCRKELEETRKREVRLREKLRDQLDGDGKRLGRKEEDTADRYDQLERELELLRTQNLILSKGTAGGSIEEKEGETALQLGKET
jgi:cell wall assembly regulator SMI1